MSLLYAHPLFSWPFSPWVSRSSFMNWAIFWPPANGTVIKRFLIGFGRKFRLDEKRRGVSPVRDAFGECVALPSVGRHGAIGGAEGKKPLADKDESEKKRREREKLGEETLPKLPTRTK